MGVKLEENLSLLLFICFINDMYDAPKNGTFAIVTIEELQLFLLLFADGTASFSYSIEGLQNLLNSMQNYCN